MRFAAIFRILGVLLMLFSLSMLPPIGVELYYRDGGLYAFVSTFFLCLIIGCLIWLPNRNTTQELKARDGFCIVVLFWTVLSFFGALPLVIIVRPVISMTDAIFETMSGLTTTGATILSNLNQLPHSLLYYRQQLQFLGGMGIIVLAVAVLPMLRIGGLQLYQAETPGPMKESKLTPRITSTAKALWYIYVGLVIVCCLSYWFAGMNLFDAVSESFSTISTGGFNIHDSSFAFYHSKTIDIIAIVFMLLGGTNFSLHFIALQQRKLRQYWSDSEFRAYVFLYIIFALIIAGVLYLHHVSHGVGHQILQSFFAVVSVGTTTGFTDDHFAHWPTFVPILMMLIAVIGGCASSTSGGVKIIRLLLLYKQCAREIKRLIHPRAVLQIKFSKQILPEHIMQAMWGFIAAFLVLYALLILAVMATGIDFTTAFGAVSATISNTGASIGKTASNFKHINTTSKWLLTFAMLAGRLEIFTILVIFSPEYWRK